MDSIIPNIPLEDLFTEMEFPTEKVPLRWWTMKTTADHLEVSERTVRRYKAEGKLEYKYVMVKGHRKVYFTNHSVIAVKEDKRLQKEVDEDLDLNCEDENLTEEEVSNINEILGLCSKLIK